MPDSDKISQYVKKLIDGFIPVIIRIAEEDLSIALSVHHTFASYLMQTFESAAEEYERMYGVPLVITFEDLNLDDILNKWGIK